MASRKWEQWEDDYLRENYYKNSIEIAIKHLNRTKDSIRSRVRILKIVKSKNPQWSSAEISFLKQNYEKESKELIIENINREWSAIKCKASELNLKRSKDLKPKPATSYVDDDIHKWLSENYSAIGLMWIGFNYVNRNQKLELKDSDGYKYSLSFCALKGCLKAKSLPLKYGLLNPHTIYNFNVLLSQNDKNFKVIEKEYISPDQDMKMECNEGHIFYKNRAFLYYEYDCPECTDFFDYSHEGIKKFVNIESQSGCILLEEKVLGSNDNILFRCKCGKPFETTFSKFKSGDKRQCNDCSNRLKLGKLEKKSNSLQQKHIETLENMQYKIVEKIDTTKFYVSDNKGYIYKISMGDISKKSPRKWFKTNKYSINNLKLEMENRGIFHELVSTVYNGTKEKLKFKCFDCKEIFTISANKILNGQGCPICNHSKGEKRIRLFLSSENINFKTEYTFDDLYGDYYKLRYDFAIFNKNELHALIEFDGSFHTQNIFNDGGFEKQQRYDKLKNEYCNNNNIKLIRIPYWDFDKIEEILEEELKDIINERREDNAK